MVSFILHSGLRPKFSVTSCFVLIGSSTRRSVTDCGLRLVVLVKDKVACYCLQCFDAVGWAAERASGL